LNYRITSQTTTGVSLSELLLRRRVRTILDLLKPNTADQVKKKQQQQKVQHDARARPRQFQVNEKVFVKSLRPGRRWLPGEVLEVILSSGPVTSESDC